MGTVVDRRTFLESLGLAPAAVMLTDAWVRPAAASPSRTSGFAGGTPVRAAMHVHGSWSEGLASWEAQFRQAALTGIDLLYMTDHDKRAMALNYITSLNGVTLVTRSVGGLKQRAATVAGGSFRLLAESSSATAPASVTLEVEPKPTAFNRLRTSIAGMSLKQTVTSAQLSGGSSYDVVVTLSYHPSAGGRAAGQYRLVYRFGGTRARWTEAGGLTGVVRVPEPAAGSVQTLVPEADASAFWPDMLAMDNSCFGLAFTAYSPHTGSVADTRIASLQFIRTKNAASDVVSAQAEVIRTYQPRYPALAVRASTEVSKSLPDMNPFCIPQWFPDYSALPTDHDDRYRAIVSSVHGQGGVISYNHPFGYDTGPLLSPSARESKRLDVFRSLEAIDLFGADIIEVGYTLRGQVDTATHLALWDTFSRRGRWLTGNGTTDDHRGRGWASLNNGFVTGLWSPSVADTDILPALAGGRAFAAHVGRWPGGELDVLVDGTIPMGAVAVGGATSRALSIAASALPQSSTVQVVSGPVDYTGSAPATQVVAQLPASAFEGGPCTVSVSNSTSRFLRVQVLAADAGIIGTGNPVWLLREQPPGGIPPTRQVR